MTIDRIRERIEQALAHGGRDGALEALRWAAAWSVHALTDDLAEPAALESVIALDEALTGLSALDARLPALIERAMTGPDLAEHLHDRSARLRGLNEAVSRLRARVEEARSRDEELRAALREHAELLERVRTLSRTERLADALDELAEQRSLIDERLARLSGPVREAQDGLHRSGGELLRLSRERREALEPRVRQAVERAAEAEARLREEEAALADAERRLAELTRRHREIRALRAERHAALRAHTDGDRRVAAALAAGHGRHGSGNGAPAADVLVPVQDILAEVDERLGEADALLAAALAERDRESAHRPIPWGDDS